jgi:hypothetical protein
MKPVLDVRMYLFPSTLTDLANHQGTRSDSRRIVEAVNARAFLKPKLQISGRVPGLATNGLVDGTR